MLMQSQHRAMPAKLESWWLDVVSSRCLTAATNSTERSTDHISTSFFLCQDICAACRVSTSLLSVIHQSAAAFLACLIHRAYHIAQKHMLAEVPPLLLCFRLLTGWKA